VAVAGLAAPALARPSAPAAQATVRGPGYPPPKGIYKPFTNCPIAVDNALMNESVGGDAVVCSAGLAANGTLTLGNITTPVVQPVNVQFGGWDPQNAAFGGDNSGGIEQFAGGILPPPAGVSAMLVTKPDLIPESLTTALGCATATDPAIQHICQVAQARGGRFNQVTALAQSAGQLTNFGVFSWTQRVKFQLINPLLGGSCSIGSDNNPVVVNPQLSLGPGGQFLEFPDPNPTAHPSTVVLELQGAVATDNTLSAPGVTGCGPGGAANIAVDQALDASSGLPAASGANTLTLNGNFFLADCFNGSNQAKILLSAIRASSGMGGTQGGIRRISGPMSAAALHKMLRRMGIR